MALSYKFRNKSGFSLLELIISVAILSIGITLILQVLVFSGKMAKYSCDIVNAVFIAEDMIQDLEFKEKEGRLKDGPFDAKDKSGIFECEYSFRQPPGLKLYELNLNVSWPGPGGRKSLNLITYLRE